MHVAMVPSSQTQSSSRRDLVGQTPSSSRREIVGQTPSTHYANNWDGRILQTETYIVFVRACYNVNMYRRIQLDKTNSFSEGSCK